MTTEIVISLTAASIYTILGGIAAIAAGATAWITWRVSKMAERIENTKEAVNKLDDRIKFMEQMKMQESQQIVQNLIVELKKNIDRSKGEATN